MKKQHQWITVLLSVSVIVLLILFILNKKKTNSQSDEIYSLEQKVETLEKKVSNLEDEKKELEEKNIQLSQIDGNSYQHNTLSPTYGSALPESQGKNDLQSGISRGLAVVVFKPSSCDYFILENSSGYILAEWMGGNDPEVGDKVSGNFNSFGTKDFYNQTGDRECRLWIDNYLLSKESALEKVNEKCN